MSRPTGRPCRGDYPRLVALADKHNLWTDDVTAHAGLFGRGDGAATMVLPNYTDRMVQFAGDGAGASVAPGLPNLTGSVEGVDTDDGKLFKGTHITNTNAGRGVGNGNHWLHSFDASRANPIYGASDTVQPAALKLIPVIRY